jgi:superfamily I DNA and/or RNA helicase
MQYFDTLPKVIYTTPLLGQKIFTNLMARVSMIPDTLQNPLVFYDYDIQEGDTPEIIAHKYYGDSYRYWIVLFANQILDPQWNWPMNSLTFQDYMASKYPSIDPNQEIHHYLQTVTTTDNSTGTTTVDEIIIDEDAYILLAETTRTYTLPNGYTSTVVTEKSTVSIYEYEQDLNEQNRNIKLVNSIYADQLEKEFKTLMAA